jgi:hypothetical protein
MKHFLKGLGLPVLMIVAAPVMASECEPVTAFIQLGQNAGKCVAAVQANNKEAKETLANYRHCSDVRMIRGAIEQSMEQMPAEKINECANTRQKEYTAAATALQKMYQLDLQLK